MVSRGAGHALPEVEKTEIHLVRGCISRVWVVGAQEESGRCMFRCDADSPMVNGLVSLLCDLYSGVTPEEVGQVETEIWEKCGFDRLLSPTRLNGLRAVRTRIRELALEMHT